MHMHIYNTCMYMYNIYTHIQYIHMCYDIKHVDYSITMRAHKLTDMYPIDESYKRR